MTARFIGWADSSFQREVGFANLDFAVDGFLAFRGSFDIRVAAVVGIGCFLLDATVVHILEILRTGNLAPGNAGVILYTDISVPMIGFTLLCLQHRYSPTGSKKGSPFGGDR